MSPNRLPIWRSRIPWLFLIGGMLLVLVLGCVLFAWRGAHSTAEQAATHSQVIEARAFASTLGVTGVITPGDVVAVTAPFDGKVTKVGFEYGAAVSQGQVLVTLDTADIDQARDEAEAEYLRATQAADDMSHWSSGPEVSQAQRAAKSAQFELTETKRKLVETKALLDKGLVARDEYDGMVQQLRNQEMALTAAGQELAEALKRGDATSRRVTSIELETASARLHALNEERAGALVRAPLTGIVVHPPSDKADATVQQMHLGMSVSKGQLIGAIAHPGGLAVTFQLSESDANRVRPGQRVQVSGPGFDDLALEGTVTNVAGEATAGTGGSSGAATFAAIARIDALTPDQAAIVRIGMSANVSIDLYRNNKALVAPPPAIQGSVPNTFVMVKDRSSGRSRRVAVRIGRVAPDGVEVLSGLKPGDIVTWSGSSQADADSAD